LEENGDIVTGKQAVVRLSDNYKDVTSPSIWNTKEKQDRNKERGRLRDDIKTYERVADYSNSLIRTKNKTNRH